MSAQDRHDLKDERRLLLIQYNRLEPNQATCLLRVALRIQIDQIDRKLNAIPGECQR